MSAGTGLRLDLGPVDQIPPGEGRAFAVGGRQVAVFRLRDGTLRALDAACPHRGGPLADGLTDAAVVVCPLHQHVFDLASGLCRSGATSTQAYAVSVSEDHTIALDPTPVPPDDRTP